MRVLLQTSGGTVSLPDPATIMIDRAHGGQLVVNPPRRVWDRTALNPTELAAWNALVAATAIGMLECLPQLVGGCVNYWDAGNWALNDAADPPGPKTGREHRFLHQHVIGRSLRSADPDWRWGESPFFPAFANRLAWSRGKAPLTAAECAAIVERGRAALIETYGMPPGELAPARTCASCGYPTPVALADASGTCPECAAATAQ